MKLSVGGTCFAGGSKANNTGVWRQTAPVVDLAKCVKCKICVDYCPDCAIAVDEEGCKIDMFYCKGCGICSNECPAGAIRMEV
ncbi:4Fe-4S binding protein [Bacilliculturomica massiliensis]|uniref:4Fe-4S binding protein n=1 Tax=Bacilliculturomica massiliensis TaxID=1917867 RepID=UPI001030D89A|nr:4Fe-4S binding protein [Bacilliculturomica massiliensis]